MFTPDLDGAGDALADATLHLLGGGSVIPRLTGFEFEPRTARIRRPVVIAGELSETDPLPADAAVGLNYLAFLASRRDHTDSFSGPGSTSILFKLAQHACQLADADAAVRLTRPASVAAVKAALEPDLVDAVAARPSQTMPRLLARSVRDVAAEPTLPDATVGDFLATVSDGDLAHLGLPDVTNAVRRATIVRNALGRLADEPTAALDRMTRAVIDVCSHRLDAWITAFATQRLAAVRATQPAGVHVGGFGWIEDLQPKVAPSAPADPPADEPGPLVTDPTNAGYVVAPSLTQAATAGILLSGHLSHAAGGRPTARRSPSISRRIGCGWRRGCSTASDRASRSARCSATGSSATCTSVRVRAWSSIVSSARCERRPRSWPTAATTSPRRSRPWSRSRRRTSSTACHC